MYKRQADEAWTLHRQADIVKRLLSCWIDHVYMFNSDPHIVFPPAFIPIDYK